MTRRTARSASSVDAVGDLLAGRDVRLLRRAAAVRGRVLLVVDERLAVAAASACSRRSGSRARGSSGSACRRRSRCGSRGRRPAAPTRASPRGTAHLLVLDAEPHGQLALEHVEEVACGAGGRAGRRPPSPGPKRDSVACTGSRSDRISTRRPGLSPTTSPPPGGITVRPIGRRLTGACSSSRSTSSVARARPRARSAMGPRR